MAALYLEHYLDSLEQLPVELQRNFTLMRELDLRSQELLRAIDKAADEMLHDFATCDTEDLSTESRKETIASIQTQYIKVKEYADDKVQLAIQTYELVDKHIRRLDADLARFEAEIQERPEKQSLQVSVQAAALTRRKSQSVALSRSVAGRKKMLQEKESGKKMRKKRLPAPSPPDESSSTSSTFVKKKKKSGNDEGDPERSKGDDEEIIDMPVDPNEPTYCFCQQVSYGQMIGCDHPDCPIEWFHFACVNLTIKPKGKWFCSKCSVDKKIKK